MLARIFYVFSLPFYKAVSFRSFLIFLQNIKTFFTASDNNNK